MEEYGDFLKSLTPSRILGLKLMGVGKLKVV